ncbi:MATE family efflux transporter [Lactococcus nasutitermitis]|uniref:Probable multidrug resistance protein NorM n=1 Tax=Lactococcus nasutitermitis TaxID=1652957 RepID=A0ABV9JF21_9LACT|nr:MATE family efflux transporter [Lactococcus nasutitermitis]
MKNQHFWRQVLSLALPVAAQGLLYAILAIVNQLMVGRLGTTAVVAVSFGSKIMGIMGFVQAGLTAGLGILAAQHVGNGDRSKIAPLQGMILMISLAVRLVFMVLSIGFPHLAMALFTADSKVIATGASYQRLLGLSYFPAMLIGVYATVLRSDGIVKLPFYMSLATVPLEAILDYGFIFGKFGLPKMGAAGAGLATTLAVLVEVVILLGLVYGKRLTGSFSLRQLTTFKWHDTEIRQLWRLTLPLLGDNLSFILADSTTSAIYGFMGTAQTVAVMTMYPVQLLLITFFNGFATAASVMIGHRLGRDDMADAYNSGKKLLWLSLIAPLVIGLFLMLPMPWYLGFYELSSYSRSLTQAVMLVMVLFVPVKVCNMVFGSILGAGGETKFIFYLSILGGWGLAVPIGLLTAFVLHWSIVAVFAAVTAEEAVRALLALHKMRQKTWLNNLVKEN